MYRGVQQWQNAMEFPVYILAGFLFPIALLPDWTGPISYALPPYWADHCQLAVSIYVVQSPRGCNVGYGMTDD
jgi:hypothetical protein